MSIANALVAVAAGRRWAEVGQRRQETGRSQEAGGGGHEAGGRRGGSPFIPGTGTVLHFGVSRSSRGARCAVECRKETKSEGGVSRGQCPKTGVGPCCTFLFFVFLRGARDGRGVSTVTKSGERRQLEFDLDLGLAWVCPPVR